MSTTGCGGVLRAVLSGSTPCAPKLRLEDGGAESPSTCGRRRTISPRRVKLCANGFKKVEPAKPVREEGGLLSWRRVATPETILLRYREGVKPPRSRLAGLSPATKRPRRTVTPSPTTECRRLARAPLSTSKGTQAAAIGRRLYLATERVIDPAVKQRPGCSTPPWKRRQTGPSLRASGPEAPPTPRSLQPQYCTNLASLLASPLLKGEGASTQQRSP